MDGDPTNTADQIPVQVICECGGSPVNVTQPIRTGPGGLPIYNGSPAQIVVCRSNYSITLQDNNRVQVYHSPNVQSGVVNQPITHTTLAAAMADDNSSRQVIRLLERGGAEFRRAANQAEYDSFPNAGRFTDASSIRWIVDIRGRIADVRWFGAISGTADNTLSIQGAYDSLSSNGGIVAVVPGTYLATNLTIPSNVMTLGNERESTILRAITSTDNHYFIQTSSYPSGNSSNVNVSFKGIKLDGAGVKVNTLVWRTWNSRIDDSIVQGSTGVDVLVSTPARNGDLLTSTMVNNVIRGCWIGRDAGTAQYNIRMVDPSNRATDMQIQNNFISSASVFNVSIASCAGLAFTGNHLYGIATINAQVFRAGLGTDIASILLRGLCGNYRRRRERCRLLSG